MGDALSDSPRRRLRALVRTIRDRGAAGRHRTHQVPLSAPAPGALRDAVVATQATLRRVLDENIIPFWQARVLDRDHGGYLVHHDPEGRWKGPAHKHLVVQSRTLWFFSRLARSGYGAGHLELAHAGFDFLRARMWDGNTGGFFWSVDHTGREPVESDKRAYGQAFGLFALSEYAAASARPEAHAFARVVADVLEHRFHDHRFGGYQSSIQTGGGATGSWSAPKSQNDHLHLLEALTVYSELDPTTQVRERLWELITILTTTVLRKASASCAESYLSDWTPAVADRERVSYGHDVEGAWLLLSAADALGAAPALLRDHSHTMLETMRRSGLDTRHGGVWYGGPPARRADDRRKVWWVQAEALVAALDHYCRFGLESAAETYLAVLKWIVAEQVDWRYGEWHDTVLPSGERAGDKAGPWKGPYHSGRAMLFCLDRLRALGLAARSDTPGAGPGGH